jgi:hypothetical protein
MTREEVEKKFPLNCQVRWLRKEYTVVDYYENSSISIPGNTFCWVVVEKNQNRSLWEVSPYDLELVHGPAVQEPEPEPNHEGMVYNPYTKQWSWF